MSPERAGHVEAENGFEYGALTPKMSVPGSPVAGTPLREAQSPISILLAVAAAQSHENLPVNRSRDGTVAVTASTPASDDDLTNLNWLQNRDLLKGMNLVTSPTASALSTPVKVISLSPFSNGSPLIPNGTTITQVTSGLVGPVVAAHYALADQSPTSDYLDDSSIADGSCSSGSVIHSPNSNNQFAQNQQQFRASPPELQLQQNGQTAQQPQASSPNAAQQRNRHPHNIPYDPLVHTANKPPYSFSCLIFMAIEDCEQKALPVKEIYAWIVDHFPYFNNAPTGWKNSVRHNLSLNKCFQKVEKASNLGKGSLWTVDQQYRPNLLQALTRSPYHPCSTLDPTVYLNKIRPDRNTISNNNNKPTTPNNNNSYSSRNSSNCSSPQMMVNEQQFTYYLPPSSVKKEVISDDSLDEVDAAAVMLSLRNPTRKMFRRNNMIITTSPSQDHTYSAADNYNGSPDEAFESGDEDRIPKRSTCRKIDFEEDEEEARRIKEGAETLLNLAGISTRKRNNSQSYDYFPFKRMKEEPASTEVTAEDSSEDKIPLPPLEQLSQPHKTSHFRPRLLRKKKDVKRTLNNNTISLPEEEDMWAKHRREMHIQAMR